MVTERNSTVTHSFGAIYSNCMVSGQGFSPD